MTIKQILDAQQPHPDADFKVDGDAISQVCLSSDLARSQLTGPQITFVGQIRNISTLSTNITYKVDDGTGIIEVKQWRDSDADQDNMDVDSKSKLAEDGYCRVWGRLKAFNGKRHVGAHVIRPITDYNEINYHLLEATAVHLFFSRGPPSGQQANKGAGMNGANGGQEEYTAGGTKLPGMSPLARKVYTALQDSPQSNEGIHCQMLASILGMPVNEVCKGADELLGNGVIFTTVDDNTWAILDV